MNAHFIRRIEPTKSDTSPTQRLIQIDEASNARQYTVIRLSNY